MLIINRYYRILTRACLILVYVSFYLVQLNVHLSGNPGVSFFSGDSVAQNSNKGFSLVLSRKHHNEPGTHGFRLNKRFHPSYLYTNPVILQDLVKYSFGIKTLLLNETQPLTNFSFNSPSLRGPPQVV